MKIFLEHRRKSPCNLSYVAFLNEGRFSPFIWHYHPEAELTLIEKGEGTRFVGDSIEPYVPGDLVLLGGSLPHTWSSEQISPERARHRAVVVQFSADLFKGSLAACPEFQAIADLLARCRRGIVFSNASATAVAGKMNDLVASRGIDAWCQLAKLLDLLARSTDVRFLASASYVPSMQHGAQRRFDRALSFISDHLADSTLRLNDVARAVHLTPTAFSRFFKRMAGRTFVSHMTGARVSAACRLLSESEDSIANIAFTCGFGNLANFNRRFRLEKAMTPSEFRGQFLSPSNHRLQP